jgi:penicillin-binding protein 1A
MGMVPNLATGVWVGGEDRSTHFSNTTYGQGATMALPIWAIFMKMCYSNPELQVSTGEFTAPKELTIETDCEKYRQQNSEEPEIPDEFDF